MTKVLGEVAVEQGRLAAGLGWMAAGGGGGEGGIGRGGVRVVIFVEKGKGVVESGGVGLVLCSSGCVGSGGWRR
jgi:hypothetical protein